MYPDFLGDGAYAQERKYRRPHANDLRGVVGVALEQGTGFGEAALRCARTEAKSPREFVPVAVLINS